MPLFFFDFADSRHCTLDDEGTECETVREARMKAVRTLTAMAKDEALDDELLDYMVSVRDDIGRVVYRATLSLAGEWPVNQQ
ncbi:DUF6894 family protein [Methylobacterium segetis]|uniref:DUF6894 family protein n=1 Tax=Methylobacterium segetis TaxID=2488750 RepID=UPI001044E80B|nr:hypothetical protein [Methylobacterium segetis]